MSPVTDPTRTDLADPAPPATGERPWWWSSQWWYLGYLLMLVFQPAFDPSSGVREWVVTIVSGTVFVALYAAVILRPRRFGRFGAPAAVVLALLTYPFNTGASVYLVFAAAFAASVGPRRLAMRWFVGLSLLTLVFALFAPVPWPFAIAAFGAPLVFVWVVGFAVLDEVERDEEAGRLRIDNARIEHLATAAERDRISRDLHDLLGQSLTEVIVRAQLVRRLAEADPARAAEEAAEIERSSRRALDEIRAAVQGWREVRIDEELDIARRALDAAGVAVVLDRDERFDPPPTTETALALALRETVTNVVRHAAASRCTITLRRLDGRDVLEVADDGRGGIPPPAGRTGTEGSGLTGMRERVLALGGDVEVADRDGRRVTVSLPAGLPA
jgi:two-component system, NarL family, sensor histidine kinase DesK